MSTSPAASVPPGGRFSRPAPPTPDPEELVSAEQERGSVIGRVLIVDDDPILAQVLSRYLQRHGMETRWVSEGDGVLAAVQRHAPDLVLLDVMLPGRDGHAICRELREASNLPVLMLTALTDEDARVAGLESGADDYVCKPFSPREVVLRIRSLLRRTRTDPAPLPQLLRDGDLSFDLTRRQLLRGGHAVSLTAREHDLLAFFMRHPDVAFTRQQLLEKVWGWSHGDLSTVTVHVRRLREKVEDDAALPQRLQTVFGVGYRYQYSEQPQ
jgi:DNA-binding response OmpR family regulator